MGRFNSRLNSKRNQKKPSIKIVNRSFLPSREEFNTNKVEKQLKQAKSKEVVLFKEGIKYSQSNTGLQFTNFISDNKQQNQISAMTLFSKDMSIIKENPQEATTIDYDTRMLSILSLYIHKDIKNVKGLMKTDIKGLLSVQEGLRVYWYYDIDDNKIKIVCIDPQHLVLPSGKGIKDKETMMIETFKKVTNSKKHCISTYFE